MGESGAGPRPATGEGRRPSSPVVCPRCGHRSEGEVPANACQWLWECEGCGALLRPLAGDCCVFCSYGTGCPSAPGRAAGPPGAD